MIKSLKKMASTTSDFTTIIQFIKTIIKEIPNLSGIFSQIIPTDMVPIKTFFSNIFVNFNLQDTLDYFNNLSMGNFFTGVKGILMTEIIELTNKKYTPQRLIILELNFLTSKVKWNTEMDIETLNTFLLFVNSNNELILKSVYYFQKKLNYNYKNWFIDTIFLTLQQLKTKNMNTEYDILSEFFVQLCTDDTIILSD